MGPDDEAAAASRRRERAKWRVRIVSLADDDAEPMEGTVEERLRATEELTRQAWALSGRPMPSYTRATMPCRIRRLQDLREDE